MLEARWIDYTVVEIFLQGRLLAARATRCDDASLCERLRTDAKASLLGALAITPSHISSLRHLANIYRMEGNIRMAEKMLRLLITNDKNGYMNTAASY